MFQLLIIIVASALRFIALDSAPPGFYVDEAAGAANVMCLQQEGRGELGDPHPLFFPAFNRNSGAFHTAPYVYSQAAWTKFVGTSPAGFRSFSALVSLLTIIGIYFLTRTIATPNAAWFAVLSAAISPWLFQFARIAWDPPLDPCFLVWALYFYFRSSKSRDAVFSGVLFALAAYAYPPARAQIPLLLPFVFAAKHLQLQAGTLKQNIKPALLMLVTATLLAIPLLQKTMSGEIQARAKMLSVFSPIYLQNTYGSLSPIGGVRAFISNFAMHLDPQFLFLTGDKNLRHSTGYAGVLSALDALALILFAVMLIQRRKLETRLAWLLAGAGFATGIAASALTWEGIPHALRSIGAAPFAAILTGLALAWGAQYVRQTRAAASIIATVFFAYFAWAYFTQYPQRAAPWFDANVLAAAHTMQMTSGAAQFKSIHHSYPASGLHYHLMQSFHEPCSRAQTLDQSP